MNSDELYQRISAEQRLLLQSVLCAGETARRAFAEWRELVDIQNLSGESHRLLPLLARRIGDIAPEDPVRGLIRGAYRLAWVKNRLIIRAAGAVASSLQAAGIPVLVLKGAALIGYYGDDPGARPMYDVDLLVRSEQIDDAFQVLADGGWSPRDGITADWLRLRVAPRRHSWAFSRGLDDQLDLHWHVLADSLGARADDGFWARRDEIDLGGTTLGVLSRPDLLLHVLAHGARSTSRSHVQWVADAVHILRAGDSAAMAEGLASEAARHGLLTTVSSALETIEVLVAEPAVRPLLQQLSRARTPMLERIATSRRGGAIARVRLLAQRLSRYGGGGEGLRERTTRLASAWLDLDYVSRHSLYVAYTLCGRSRVFAALARRRWATFVRTSRSPSIALRHADLDFASGPTPDHHAGPGWWAFDDQGITSHGKEGRLVVDLRAPREEDLALRIVARSYDHAPRLVDVRVNERTVAHATIGAGSGASDVRVHVPAAVAWRFRPMEIALLGTSNGLGRARARLGIRILRIGITSNGSRAPEPPGPPPHSPPDDS